MYIIRFILFFIFSLFVSPILADSHKHEHHDDEEYLFEEHTSHVHGHAAAQVSYVESVLNINKTLSSIDVFEFEHAPKNAIQKNKIMQSIEILENGENLFRINNNACKLESVHIENGIFESGTYSQDNHENNGDDDEENNNGESHTNVVANYIFNCDNEKLESIEYLIFDHFPSLEVMEIEYIANDHQALFNATPSNRIQKLN